MRNQKSICFLITVIPGLVVIGVLLARGSFGLGSLDSPDLLQDARQYLKEKSYQKALARFHKALSQARYAAQKDTIRLDIGSCLQGLKKWRDAIQHLERLIQDRARTLTEARARARVADVFFRKPHHAYFKDGKDLGINHVPGARYRFVEEEDLLRAKQNLEAARVLYGRFLLEPTLLKPEEVRSVPEERSALNFQFVQVLERLQTRIGGWRYGGNEEERKKRQDRIRPLHATVLQLMGENYLTAVLSSRTRDASRALYHKAMYLRRYCQKWWARDMKTGKLLPLKETPEGLLTRLINEFPEDGFVDDAMYSLGLLAAGKKSFPEAIQFYSSVIKKFPASRWSKDAAQQIRRIQRPIMEMKIGNIRLPGTEPVIKIDVRNIPEIIFTAYRIPLERYLGNAEGLKALQTAGFHNLARTLTEIAGQGALRQNREAGWTVRTPDEGKHRRHNDIEVKVPVSGSGAFLIEAAGAETVQAAVLVISDLAIVRKRARSHSLFFVADARTGAPMDGVHIVARQKSRKRQGMVNKGRTDTQGLWTCPHRFPFGFRYNYIDAFAWVDGRYALTGWTYQSMVSSKIQGKVFGFTDRGVYRPGQTVRYSAILRAGRKDGLYENLPDRSIALELRDPRGKKFLLTGKKTDAYGMVQGSWTIPGEATLGRYLLLIKTRRGRRLRTTVSFRVEEYKRPEFEVMVTGEGAVRVGEVLSAKIAARYYFGGAVAGAKVKYRVFRESYHHRFRFNDPFSFLYDRPAGQWRGGSRYAGRTSPELVRKGEATLDAQGTFFLQVSTAPWVKKYPTEHHAFRIKAEVMDRSRRTIEGVGKIKITATEYFAALQTRCAFLAPGETATIEVRAENPDGQPVAVGGVIKVFETEPRPVPGSRPGKSQKGAGEVKERLVHTLPVSTDSNGRAILEWKADEEGYFLLRYEGRDEAEAVVMAESPLWVCGKNWKGRSYRYQNMEILTDRDTYRVGDRARVLINTQVDNPTLLLSREADHDILSHEVRRVNGRSLVLELPIRRAMEPNFFLDGLLVHDGKVFRTFHEVFVPPVKQFLNVDVAFAGNEYRPGQTGEALIRLRDVEGKPVAGRIALGTVDASLDYIQGDAAADIRKFFYGRRRRHRVSYQDSFSFRSCAMAWKQVKLPPHRYAGNPPGWYSFPRLADLWSEDQENPSERKAGLFQEEKQSRQPRGARRAESRGFLDDGVEGEEMVVGRAAGKSARAAGAADPGAPGRELKKKAGFFGRGAPIGLGGGGAAAAKVRENFAETAFFDPAVQTGLDGTARVAFTFPDCLTRWRTTARAYTRDTRVGQKRAYVVTTKKLLVRPQVPRFFRERDEVVVSALVNSYLEAETSVEVALEVGGGTLHLQGRPDRRVAVQPGGEVRVDWRLEVVKSGKAEVLVKAHSADFSDAVKRTFPVLRYGSARTVTRTAALGRNGKADLAFVIPPARAPGSASLEVTLNPSLAGVLLDAMPYLLQYPHGCVEQTMSRFLPAVVTRATLRRMGVNLEDIQKKRKDLLHAAEQAGNRDPVFDSDTMHDIITRGLERLQGFQRQDGGFCWFPGGRPDPYMTAYVVVGLKRALEAEVKVDGGMLKRALDFLERETKQERNLHRAVVQCFALAFCGRAMPGKVFAGIFRAREELNHYGRALLALAAHHAGRSEPARITLENLEDFLQHDSRTGASFLPAAGSRWCWWSDAVETNAFALMAFNAIQPGSPHREGLARWLVASRKGSRWRSTKDTAHAIYALVGFMETTGELDPDFTAEVFLDGEPVTSIRITRENLLTFENRIRIPAASLSTGEHTLSVTRSGRGRLYAMMRFTYFSLEDVIPAAGHDMKVSRTYYRVTPASKQVDGRTQLFWNRELLCPGARIKAGETLEVELGLDAFHDYEYMMMEDPRPAGFEPVALRSGQGTRGGLWTHMELRDDRVVFFLPRIPRGRVVLPYRVRAEVPGTLSAMPLTGGLMYAPEVGGNSVSWKVEVVD